MRGKLSSRSFWLAAGIAVASAWFTQTGILDGGQWVTLALGVLGLWQAGDKAEKALSGRGR